MKRSEQNRGDSILAEFARLYPEPASELHFRNDFELVVAVVLSAQCTDKKVNEVTKLLFEEYPTAEFLSQAPIASLEAILRPINYYRTKAKHVRELAAALIRDHGGAVPTLHSELTALPGVGRKTANVVLSERGITPAFPVDTHVFRVSQRLGFAVGATPIDIERALTERFPSELWRPLHHWLILHGRRVCIAQRPKCEVCTVREWCPVGRGKE